MAIIIFWTSAFILCILLLTSHAKGTVESAVVDPLELGRTGSFADQQTKEWVDPFDMTHYSHGEKRMVKDFYSNKAYKSGKCQKNEMEKNFLQRLVNLLINHCENDTVEATAILLTVTPNQLRELNRLKDATDSEATIRALNKIFSYMTVHEKSSWIMWITEFSISDEVWSNIAAMSFALLPLCVFIMGGTMRRIMLILSLAVFSVSYYKTQQLLLKKIELQNERILMKQIDCSRPKYSWWGRSNNEAECLKQLHAQKIDPYLEVTPIKVISHMTAIGVLEPMEHFGIMFSRFSNKIFESHSLLYGLVVFLVASLIIIFVIGVCSAMIFGRSFNVGVKQMSLGITAAQQNTKRRPTSSVEPALESEVATKPNTEMAIYNHGHHPQPVIQIIHNYPIKDVDESIVKNDIKVTNKKDKNNRSEMKMVDSVEESHKICEVTPDGSSKNTDIKKQDTSKESDDELRN